MNRRPLYKEAQADVPHYRQAGGHAGLWFDKYAATWDLAALRSHGGRDAIDKRYVICSVQVAGDRALVEEAAARHRALVEARRGATIPAVSCARFVTGVGRPHPTETGFAWHATLGTPYLPGSSVKGAVRGWATSWCDTKAGQIERIFGPRAGPTSEPNVGSVVFFDAIPTRPVPLGPDILNPHHVEWYRGDADAVPSDDQSPVPVFFLSVPAGAQFLFGLAPRRAEHEDDRRDAQTAKNWLLAVLEHLGIGAKTAAGYGRFEVDHAALEAQQRERAEIKARRERERAEIEARRERERAIAAATTGRSPAYADLYTAAQHGGWERGDDAARDSFLAPANVDAWLERLEREPDADAVAYLGRLLATNLKPGILDDPDRTNAKGKPAFKKRQVDLVHRYRRLAARAERDDATDRGANEGGGE